MITVYAIHKPEADKLAQVVTEMRALGAPTIEVVDCGDHYQALEGSHRLAAAAELGLTPKFMVHAQDEIIDITRFDWYEELIGNFAETEYAAGEIAGEVYSYLQAVPYSYS
jgi:hypothetical protein